MPIKFMHLVDNDKFHMVYYEEMSYRNGVEMSNFESPNKVV